MSRLAVIVAPQNRGWILERMGREVANRWHGPSEMVLGRGRSIPRADRYFFTHWSLATEALELDPSMAGRSVVLFTHPPSGLWRKRPVIRALGELSIASMSTVHATRLRRLGVPAHRVHVVLPGSEPNRFPPHRRGSGVVGMNAAYYPRKAPERIHALVRALPERPFLLVGQGWRQWHGFDSLLREPNFEYVEASTEDHPTYYARMDVFVSLSTMEGGPIPLLEAMLSNAVPVVTDTGFARDVVRHGQNGFVVPVHGRTSRRARLVEQAFSFRPDIRPTVEHLTWPRFGDEICALLRSTDE